MCNILIFAFQLTTVLAVVEDAGGAAAPGEEGQRRRHQPVHDAALPRSQSGTASCRDEDGDEQMCYFFFQKQIHRCTITTRGRFDLQASIELPLVDLMSAPFISPQIDSKSF